MKPPNKQKTPTRTKPKKIPQNQAGINEVYFKESLIKKREAGYGQHRQNSSIKNNQWRSRMNRKKVNITKGEQKYNILIQCNEIDGNVQAEEIFHKDVTCCKSSLSDFNWATRALMQPFIEHNVACSE